VLSTSVGDPAGFYTITVDGTDGKGNYGSTATVVRVAKYSLSVKASLSNPVVSVQNGNESQVLAEVTYLDGSSMTIGTVIGYLFTDAFALINWFPMAYNSRAGGFVAINLFHAVNATVTPTGNYWVYVEAYDSSGNYGNAITSFFVGSPPWHAVAVNNVFSSKTIVGQGFSVNLAVTVMNVGNYTETFQVTAYANTTSIASQNITLPSGNSANITLVWNTTGSSYGNYALDIKVTLALEETNVANNTFVYGIIKVTIPGDINGDDVVNAKDLGILTAYWLKTVPPTPANVDIGGYGIVNAKDLGILATYWLQSWK
jgi:hypothetical protein